MDKRYNADKKANTQKRVVIFVLIALALAATAVLLLRSCGDDPPEDEPDATPVYLEDEGSAIEGEAEANDREEIMNELEKRQLVVTDNLSSNITFASGEAGTIGDWTVENPKENSIIQQAEVYLDDVLIAKSAAIYPNQHITSIELLTDVESGEYEVTAYLNYYDISTKEYISKAGYTIHLTVR